MAKRAVSHQPVVQSSLALEGFNFNLPDMAPSVVISIEGTEKSGKSDLASRAPGPIIYMALDLGEDGVVQKHQRGVADRGLAAQRIGVKRYTWAWSPQIAQGDYEAQGEYLKTTVWKEFQEDYQRALHSEARSIVWDTATEVWELHRLTKFGKLLQNPQMFYGPLNAEFKEMVRRAKIANKNLILLHQQKEEQVEEVVMRDNGPQKVLTKTGRMLRQGMSKIGNLVDAYVETRYVPPVFETSRGKRVGNERIDGGYFEVEVLRARHNEPANGMILKMPSFEDVAEVCMPEVEWSSGRGRLSDRIRETIAAVGDLGDLGI